MRSDLAKRPPGVARGTRHEARSEPEPAELEMTGTMVALEATFLVTITKIKDNLRSKNSQPVAQELLERKDLLEHAKQSPRPG